MAAPQDHGDFLSWLWGQPGQVALAGAAGGLVRTLTLRENWREGAVTIVIGTICAIYLSPLAAPVLDPVLTVVIADLAARASFYAFVTGVGGIGVSGFLIDVWKARRNSLQTPKEPDNAAPKP